jgi:hypothetical protein
VPEKETNSANSASAANHAAFNLFILTTLRNNPFVFNGLGEMIKDGNR